MSTSKMTRLLIDSAHEFRKASSPFNTEWLSENQVTSDECYTLSIIIADAIEYFIEHHYEGREE